MVINYMVQKSRIYVQSNVSLLWGFERGEVFWKYQKVFEVGGVEVIKKLT